MAREDHQNRLAELLALDLARRAGAEPEIARKEARLAEARARLSQLEGEESALEAELEAARADQVDLDDPSA